MSRTLRVVATVTILGGIAAGLVLIRGEAHRHAGGVSHTHQALPSRAPNESPAAHSHGGHSHSHATAKHNHSHSRGKAHSHSHGGAANRHSHARPHGQAHHHGQTPAMTQKASAKVAEPAAEHHADGAHWHISVLGLQLTIWDPASFFYVAASEQGDSESATNLASSTAPRSASAPTQAHPGRAPRSGHAWTIPATTAVELAGWWLYAARSRPLAIHLVPASGEILSFRSDSTSNFAGAPPVPPPRTESC